MRSIYDLVSSKRDIFKFFRSLFCMAIDGTSLDNKSVTSITIAVESALKAFIGNENKIGSKLEFTTASCIGRESLATMS